MCAHCDKLQTVYPIQSPDDLKAMLLRAADYLDNGTLAEIFSPDEAVAGAIADNAPSLPAPHYVNVSFWDCGYFGMKRGKRCVKSWNNLVGHTFQCRHCGAVFELSAETYHGSGGAWKYAGTRKPLFQAEGKS